MAGNQYNNILFFKKTQGQLQKAKNEIEIFQLTLQLPLAKKLFNTDTFKAQDDREVVLLRKMLFVAFFGKSNYQNAFVIKIGSSVVDIHIGWQNTCSGKGASIAFMLDIVIFAHNFWFFSFSANGDHVVIDGNVNFVLIHSCHHSS
jgi:hypothetical protein